MKTLLTGTIIILLIIFYVNHTIFKELNSKVTSVVIDAYKLGIEKGADIAIAYPQDRDSIIAEDTVRIINQLKSIK